MSFGSKPDTSAQQAAQQKQLALQEQQQLRLDNQERDQKAAALARLRAGTTGGTRALMSILSYNNAASSGSDMGSQSTLGSA